MRGTAHRPAAVPDCAAAPGPIGLAAGLKTRPMCVRSAAPTDHELLGRLAALPGRAGSPPLLPIHSLLNIGGSR